MSKSTCRGLIVTATVLLILCAFLSTPTGGGANAYVSESDFYLKTFEMLGSAQYYNATEGCTYRVPISRLAYEDIIKVEYDVVPLISPTEELEVDENNKVKPEREGTEHYTVLKSDLVKYSNPTEKKYAYFDITAHFWCAFVFTVHYGDGQKAYDSEILYCKTIDNSVPEAYYTSYYFDGGAYVFKVTVNGNTRGDRLSANSGLKAFKVLRRSASGQWTEVSASQTVSGLLSTTYEMRTELGQATYYMDIIDNVGNPARVPIVTFTSAKEDGKTTAADNALIDMEAAGYSENLINALREAKSNYELLLQLDGVSDDELEAAGKEITDVLGYFAHVEKLRKEGKKDYSVRTFNVEYLGEVDIINSGKANLWQKYGDKADYTVNVAKFSPNDVDRKESMKIAGVKSASAIYTLTLTLSDGANTVEREFNEPLIIRIPREFKNVSAVQTSGDVRTAAKIINGNGYTDVYVSYSYGTVDLFVAGNNDNYLWLLMIIPVVIAVAIAVVVVAKRKKDKNSQKLAADTEVRIGQN